MAAATTGQQVSRRAFLRGAGAAAACLAAGRLGAEAPAPAAAAPVNTALPADWAHVRETFGLPGRTVHLNTGSLGLQPALVREAVTAAAAPLGVTPVGHFWGPLLQQAEAARARAAAFLGCAVGELSFTDCTTDGMNQLALGLDLAWGDHVLTTDQEHPGGSVCWEYLVRRRAIVVDRVKLPAAPVSGAELVRLLTDAMTDKTRVISVSHVTYTTGLRLPVAALAALAHQRGAVPIVDGAQAAGALAVDLHALGCDAYATSGHKWLCGPAGTGLLYVAATARERIAPLALTHGPAAYTGATGTRNLPGAAGLGAALGLFAGLGAARIEEHNLALRARLIAQLQTLPAAEVLSPPVPELASPLVTFRLRNGPPPDALEKRLLDEDGIAVKTVHGAFAGNRVSLHLYNDEADVARLVAALQRRSP